LRQDLRDLSESDDLTWIDVTAPGDGCSFALCDPVAVCGVARDTKNGRLSYRPHSRKPFLQVSGRH